METTFGEITVGTQFFDPYSGENFVKINENCGTMLAEDWGQAVFKLEEPVQV